MSPAPSAAVTSMLSLSHVLLLDPGGMTGKCVNCGHHMSSTAAAATCQTILALVAKQVDAAKPSANRPDVTTRLAEAEDRAAKAEARADRAEADCLHWASDYEERGSVLKNRTEQRDVARERANANEAQVANLTRELNEARGAAKGVLDAWDHCSDPADAMRALRAVIAPETGKEPTNDVC